MRPDVLLEEYVWGGHDFDGAGPSAENWRETRSPSPFTCIYRSTADNRPGRKCTCKIEIYLEKLSGMRLNAGTSPKTAVSWKMVEQRVHGRLFFRVLPGAH